MDRCHRIGQTREVVVRRFVVRCGLALVPGTALPYARPLNTPRVRVSDRTQIEGTVEEKMLAMQASKSMLVSAALNGDDGRQERVAALRALFS